LIIHPVWTPRDEFEAQTRRPGERELDLSTGLYPVQAFPWSGLTPCARACASDV
jgi:hypothetical protein